MFPWRKSRLARIAESCEMIHEGKHYWLVAATTIKDDEFQSLANGVRITKELFAYMAEAKAECERWYNREVLGLEWDAGGELGAILRDKISWYEPDGFLEGIEDAVSIILDKFTITPKR